MDNFLIFRGLNCIRKYKIPITSTKNIRSFKICIALKYYLFKIYSIP